MGRITARVRDDSPGSVAWREQFGSTEPVPLVSPLPVACQGPGGRCARAWMIDVMALSAEQLDHLVGYCMRLVGDGHTPEAVRDSLLRHGFALTVDADVDITIGALDLVAGVDCLVDVAARQAREDQACAPRTTMGVIGFHTPVGKT
jgi:hypothetical protein